VSSNGSSDDLPLDPADLAASPDEVRVLRALRAERPSWFDLSPEEIDALLPPSLLDRRPPAPPDRRPFTLEADPPEGGPS
jgi:hypothetical protein